MHENLEHTTTAPERDARRRRGGTLVRFGLAGVAVLGIGAAATSAAWTDQAWFAGTAGAADVELQASVDGQSWFDADTSGDDVAVTIPADAFDALNQGEERTLTLHLRNDGTVPLTLGDAVVTTDSSTPTSVFAGDAAAQVTVSAPATDRLAADATTTATITVTTPPDWPATYQDRTGVLTVAFTGQS